MWLQNDSAQHAARVLRGSDESDRLVIRREDELRCLGATDEGEGGVDYLENLR